MSFFSHCLPKVWREQWGREGRGSARICSGERQAIFWTLKTSYKARHGFSIPEYYLCDPPPHLLFRPLPNLRNS